MNGSMLTPEDIATQNHGRHSDVVNVLAKCSKKCAVQLDLHEAIMKENQTLEIVKKFFQDAKNNNVQTDDIIDGIIGGRTPIYRAAELDKADVVQELIRQRANVNLGDLEKWSPLEIARYEGHLDVVKVLLAAGAEGAEKEDYIELLHHACDEEKPVEAVQEVFDIVAKSKIETNIQLNDIINEKFDGQTPISLAVARGSEDLVKHLIDNGVNPVEKYEAKIDQNKLTKDIKEIVIELLGESNNVVLAVNIGPLHWSVLHFSVWNNQYASVEKILDHPGLDIINKLDDFGQTALHKAAIKGFDEIVDILLKQKDVDVHAKDTKGATALFLAAKNGHTDVVSMLLKSLANPNVNLGATLISPLEAARKEKHFDVVKVLLDHGAEGTEKEDYIKWLHHACGKEKPVEAVQEVLDIAKNKASIQSKDIINEELDGQTLIFRAAARGSEDLVKHLIDKGAHKLNGGNSKHSQVWGALEGRHDRIVNFLLGRKCVEDQTCAEGEQCDSALAWYNKGLCPGDVRNNKKPNLKKKKKNKNKKAEQNQYNDSIDSFNNVFGRLDKYYFFRSGKKLDLQLAQADVLIEKYGEQLHELDDVDGLPAMAGLTMVCLTYMNRARSYAEFQQFDSSENDLLRAFKIMNNEATKQTLQTRERMDAAIEVFRTIVDAQISVPKKQNFHSTLALDTKSNLLSKEHYDKPQVLQRIQQIQNTESFDLAIQEVLQVAFFDAAEKGWDDLIAFWSKLKLKFDANVKDAKRILSVKDAKGATALHYAARGGCDKVVSMLLKEGAYVNAVDANDLTALHWAVTNKKLEVARMCVDSFWDSGSTNNFNCSIQSKLEEISRKAIRKCIGSGNSYDSALFGMRKPIQKIIRSAFALERVMIRRFLGFCKSNKKHPEVHLDRK